MLGEIINVVYYTYDYTGAPAFYSMMVTFGTVFYHFGMRLAVGGIVNARFHNHMNYRRKWFREKHFEKSLYKKLKVKKWKDQVPTFAPETFTFKRHQAEEIVQASCQAEVVHEIIMVFSFVPLVFSIWAGATMVFVITSCAACLLDLIFVIVQRYNRPRLFRLIR
ncbi:MAG: hypothetical protein LUF78_10410 [Clostridiales bacterium]|nr:hypothetical protein [Clostridiales bacterium]